MATKHLSGGLREDVHGLTRTSFTHMRTTKDLSLRQRSDERIVAVAGTVADDKASSPSLQLRKGNLSSSSFSGDNTCIGRTPKSKGRHRRPPVFRMSWIMFVYAAAIILSLVVVGSGWESGLTLPSIHWNSTNSMFKTSNNDHIIDVNIGDQVDFVCPYHDDSDPEENLEYYIIYQVTKREYDDCNIYSSSRRNVIVNCSSPRQRKKFTLLFLKYSPIPNGQEFERGGTYYYISTSTGSEEGLMNMHQGACLNNNMKLTIKVCCDTTTTDNGVNTTTLHAPTTPIMPANDSESSLATTTTPVPPTTTTKTTPTTVTSRTTMRSTSTQISPKFDWTSFNPGWIDDNDVVLDKTLNENEVIPISDRHSSQASKSFSISSVLLTFIYVLMTLLLR